MGDNSGSAPRNLGGRPRGRGRKAPLLSGPRDAISSSQRPASKRARSADAAAPSRGVDEVHAPGRPALRGPGSRGGAVGQPAATASVAAGAGGSHLGAQGGGIDFEPGPARDVRFIVSMDDGYDGEDSGADAFDEAEEGGRGTAAYAAGIDFAGGDGNQLEQDEEERERCDAYGIHLGDDADSVGPLDDDDDDGGASVCTEPDHAVAYGAASAAVAAGRAAMIIDSEATAAPAVVSSPPSSALMWRLKRTVELTLRAVL